MEPAKETWEKALGELQVQINKANYDTWLRNSQGISCEDEIFTVGVHSAFVAEWLNKRLYPLIRKTLVAILGREIEVRFVIQSQGQEQSSSLARIQADGGVSTKVRVDKFNPKYTLDNFIVGKSNHLAYVAAKEIAENPGHAYNPFFIYSDSGQGKTHLLHAIGNVATSKGLQVIYSTGEQFTNEFVSAIKRKEMEDFRNKFINIHMLLFDDVQFISDKKQTRQCFYHIFNELSRSNSQIVITADCTPEEMPSLSNKLISRLECGLVVPIEPPDFDMRLAILQAKAKETTTLNSDEPLKLLAKQAFQNIRQLEGALIYLDAQAKLNGTNVTPQMVNNFLLTCGKENKKSITHVVANYFNLAEEELISKRRDRKTTLVRQIAIYLMRQEDNCPFSQIGRELGNRSHTTIIYNYEKIAAEINTNLKLQQQILEIKKNLNSRETS